MEIGDIVKVVLQLFSGAKTGQAATAPGGGLESLAPLLGQVKTMLTPHLEPRQAEQLDKVEQNTATQADKEELHGGLTDLLANNQPLKDSLLSLVGPALKDGGLASLLGGASADGGGLLGKLGGALGGLLK